jgi:hypothetical protein
MFQRLEVLPHPMKFEFTKRVKKVPRIYPCVVQVIKSNPAFPHQKSQKFSTSSINHIGIKETSIFPTKANLMP